MTPEPGIVAQQIRVLRLHRGMSQEDFAYALGVSRSTVAQWETGRGGETHHLSRIAQVLGVQIELFLNGMASNTTVETLTVDEAELIRLYRRGEITDRILSLRLVAEPRKAYAKRGSYLA